jgi:hypothetical protein
VDWRWIVYLEVDLFSHNNLEVDWRRIFYLEVDFVGGYFYLEGFDLGC